MDRWLRWVFAIVFTLALIGLVVLARGEPRHGEPTPAPAAAAVMA